MRHYTVPPIPASIWQKPTHFIAFGFGVGALPFAPGTFGTLIAIPFYLALQALPLSLYLFMLLFITLGSMWLCDRVSKEIKVDDHQGMCLDEIVGFLVTMTYAPHGIGWIIAGFILFRLFDILKPWPIHWVDNKIHGGVGAILDDVLAGVYSFAIMYLLARII